MRPAARLRARRAMALGLVALVGCIDVPDKEEPQCRIPADCDQPAGEVCEEGVCWGDPPAGPLAAIIGPPGDAKDLVPAEIPMLVIPPHGLLDNLVLGTPVTIRGKVLRECTMSCPPTPVPVKATIRVTRPSSFPGGPGLSITEETAADGSYVLHLPLTRMGRPNQVDDPPYAVTITPSDRGATRPTLFASDAEDLPPRRMTLIATQDVTINLLMPSMLSMPPPPVVRGRVLDGAGAGLAGYRVAARGSWVDGEPTSEVSTVAVTAPDGSYQLTLSGELVGKVTVRATPPEQPSPLPTTAAVAEIAEVDGSADSSAVDFQLPAAQRAPIAVTVPVRVRDSGGQETVVAGVTARLHFELFDDQTKQTLRYAAEGKSNDAGLVTLMVVPGVAATTWPYRLSLLPPADSKLATVFDEPVDVVPGTLVTPMLKERARITGILREGDQPMKNVTLTVRPSRSFLQELDMQRRTFVDEIAATTATTSKTGEFVAYADPQIVGVTPRYSLSFQPPDSDFAPTWTHAEEIAMPAGIEAGTVNIGEIFAVEASNIHGRIVNPGGRPVAKARVLIYKLDDSCVTQGCSSTAQLIGLGVSDDDGQVRVALPKEP